MYNTQQELFTDIKSFDENQYICKPVTQKFWKGKSHVKLYVAN